MGDEVKITVIATGFRDQMPERRARMLTMSDVTAAAVPVVTSESWLDEPQPAPAAEQGPPRFQSEEEEPQEEASKPVFAAAETEMPAIPVVAPAPADSAALEEEMAAPARPKFEEMNMEPAYTPLPRDYASELGSGVGGGTGREEANGEETAEPFSPDGEGPERDLDVPAFMRRLPF